MASKTYNAVFPVIEYYEGWLLVCIFFCFRAEIQMWQNMMSLILSGMII